MRKVSTILLLIFMLFNNINISEGAPHRDILTKKPGSDHRINHDRRLLKPTTNPGFTFSPSSGCAPLLVCFSSKELAVSAPYEWDFGDGSGPLIGWTNNECKPCHIYNTPGTYIVTFKVNGNTYTDIVNVYGKPTGTISPSNPSPVHCISTPGDVFTFNPPPGSPYTYLWSVQNGTIVGPNNGISVSVNWIAGGFNTVKVQVFSGPNCSEIFEYQVYVMDLPKVKFHCCEPPKQDPNSGHTVVQPGGEQELPPPDTCNVCVNATNCYSADITDLFGPVSDYTWFWSATGGTVTSGQGTPKACITWTTVGTGTIELTVTHNASGCVRKVKCNVHILPGITPVLNFVNPNCIGNVTFDLNSTLNASDIVWVKWEFGDGKSTSGPALTATNNYTTAGTYFVTVTVTNKAGCQFVVTNSVTINNGTYPTIVCVSTVCANSSASYSTTSIPGASYSWTVTGDAAPTVYPNSPTINVAWGAGPVGTVTVNVTGGGYTCRTNATVSVPIINPVIPVQGPSFICQDITSFTVSTENYQGACYTWTVVSGGWSMGTNANKLIVGTNPYSTVPVVIKVDVDFGLNCCKGSGTITVNKKPRFYITGPVLVCENTTTAGYAINTFLPGFSATGYIWTATNGTPLSGTGATNSITWGIPGQGQVLVTNTNPAFCNTAASLDVTIVPKATGDDIEGPTVVCQGKLVKYFFAYDMATVSAVIKVNGVTQVPSSPGVMDYAFSTVGVNTITVTYSYNAGPTPCGVTKTLLVNVVPAAPPIITMVSPTPFVCLNSTSQFQSNISLYTGAYEWEVKGGTFTESVAGGISTITVTWASTVNTSVIIRNKVCGGETVYPMEVRGVPLAPMVSSITNCSNGNFSVTDVWDSYQWYLDGVLQPGATAASSPTLALLPISSPHTVMVRISVNGCYSDFSTGVPAHTLPVINSVTYTIPCQQFCPPRVSVYADVTGEAPISYNWNSGASSQNPATLPSTATGGTGWALNYSLVVTDRYGCTANTSGTFTGTCVPQNSCTSSTMSVNSYDFCTGVATYTIPSDITCLSYPGKQFFFNACGNQSINMYGFNTTNNCWETYSYPIYVPYVLNMVDLKATGATNCLPPNGVNLSGFACVTPGYTEQYTWYVDGGLVSYSGGPGNVLLTTLDPSLTSGIHTIKVVAEIYNGGTLICSRTLTETVNLDGLKADFAIQVCGYCANNPVSFTDLSVPYKAPIIRWDWTIVGAGLSSNIKNPTFYLNPGTYTVTLRIIDNFKCTATITKIITVTAVVPPGPLTYQVNGGGLMPITAGTPVYICKNDNVMLYGPVPPGGVTYTYSWSNGITGTGPAFKDIIITGEGEYYLDISENSYNCKFRMGPFVFTYKPNPVAKFITSPTPCTPFKLEAYQGNGYSYSWTPAGTVIPSNTPTAYIYTPGTYSIGLTVTNMFGCSNTTTTSISLYPTPGVSLSAAPWCPPAGFPLITASAYGGTPSYGYAWTVNGAPAPGTGNTFLPVSPGVHGVTVTDVHGCQAKNTLEIKYEVPSIMSTIPQGCYTSCTTVNFCAGIVPNGYVGQWYKAGSGTPIATFYAGSAVGISIASTGVYTFVLSPAIAGTGCTYTSQPLDVTITPLPAISITGAYNHQQLCPPTTSVTLTATPVVSGYNYTWTKNGSYYGTGASVLVSTPGTYRITVEKCGCSQYAEIIIDPCESPSGCDTTGFYYSKIKVIGTNLTVSNNQLWEGKFYVMPNVIITVTASATLDLTNVDMMFGEKAGIVFNTNAKIRANNSVFRPCNPASTWLGMSFLGNSTGWINTCTYKNAEMAINVSANKAKGVRITDNSFIKCNIGVNLSATNNHQSVSGNSFEIDATVLPFSSTLYYGIKMRQTTFAGTIANNRFRQVNGNANTNTYYGIHAINSQFTASTNTFTDMFRGIELNGNIGVTGIEKNTFKVNTPYENFGNQVRAVGNSNPVLIYSNDFDLGVIRNNVPTAAIYMQNNYHSHVKANTINQFGVSLYMERNQDCHVTSNTVTNGVNTGMQFRENVRSVVSCNSITMLENQTDVIGSALSTGLFLDNENSDSRFFTNCIMNSSNAIWAASSSGGGQLIPFIRNNYLYNYFNYGLLNLGYTGDIGISTAFNDAGRNTFISNNNGFAVDVFSTFALQTDGNYGMNTIAGGAYMFFPTDQLYSTANCGLQIHPQLYSQMRQDILNICDQYYLDKSVVVSTDGGFDYKKLSDAFTTALVNQKHKDQDPSLYSWINAHLAQTADLNELEAAIQTLKMSEISADLSLQLIAAAYLRAGYFDKVSELQNDASFATVNTDLKFLVGVKTALAQNSLTTINSDIPRIEQIRDQDGPYAVFARDLLQSLVGGNDFIFNMNEVIYKKESKNKLEVRERSLKVYPVPASSEIFVTLSNANEVIKDVKIYNAVGAEVFNYSKAISSGTIKINIEALSQGMYYISIVPEDKSQKMLSTRFVKN